MFDPGIYSHLSEFCFPIFMAKYINIFVCLLTTASFAFIVLYLIAHDALPFLPKPLLTTKWWYIEGEFFTCISRVLGKFVDTIRLLVKGGNGGMGLPKYKGVGGRGGSVYLSAEKGVTLRTVLHKYTKRKIAAESGENSRPMKIYGEKGKDKVVAVPPGVTIYDEYMRRMGELNNVGDRILVAEGGPGGSPSSNPTYSGASGHSQTITVDLKLIADVGLVGFPNAGKSTLLKAVSRANPQIAAYAFTTLRPNVGVIEYPDLRQIKMADLPGLIEGASHNLGMGHKFLKHVERSSLLLFVVDINGFQLTPQCKRRSCLETVIILNKELELYNPEMLNKPAILAVNKMDLPGAPSSFREIDDALRDLSGFIPKVPEEIRPEKIFKFDTIVPISAKHDDGSLQNLKNIIRETVDKYFELSLKETMTKQEIELLKRIKLENTEISKVKV